MSWVTIKGNHIYIDDDSVDENFSLSDAITEHYKNSDLKIYYLSKKEYGYVQSEINSNYGNIENCVSYVCLCYNNEWYYYFYVRKEYDTFICMKISDDRLRLIENKIIKRGKL